MSLPKPEFAHLHVHTEYSLLDGACRLDQLCDRAKELNFEQIAVTDHGSMSGLLTLQKAADKAGIKPILGIEAYQAPIHRTERDNDNRYYHITLLAENDEGFLNLSRMNYHAAREGMYYAHPRMDMELLRRYGEGVIVLTGCMAGAVMQALIRADKEPDQRKREHAARDEILKLADAVGKENVYIEVQNSGVKDYGSSQWEWNAQLQKIAKDLGMTIVGTSDTHYLDADPSKGPRYGTPYYHELLLCVQTKKHTIHTPPSERMSLIHDWDDPHYYHLRSAAEMREMLANVPESVGNSLLVAERCNARIHTGRTFEMLPDFPVPDDYRPEGQQPETMDEKVWRQESYLRERVYEGLRRLYGDPIPGEVVERAEYELGVINSMGTTSYFLITWDWIRYAREIGVVVGPGRGSGAGSLVCYALDITRLDPLKFGLLFERFLSPDRISMPDIDTDVSGRQEEIRAYLNEKYGEENCAQIITFQTIGGKAGILSAAKAIGGHDLQGLARKMSSAMPMKGQVPVSLSEALDKDSGHYGVELNQIINNSPEAKQIIEAAQWMEGLVSAESVHAAAFVISPFALTDALPVVVNKDGFNVTAFAMKEAEEVGVLKLDLLGLRNLQILADAQDLIKKRRGIEVNAKEYEIPLEDKKTYDMLAKGESVGVFQFESTGMQDTLKTIGVTEFNDLIAIVAAYRPGAMDQIPTYARRKRGIEEVTYGDPRMEQHLKETYGLCLFQEQSMLLARDLAGFTGGLMDKLRKAIGKKNMELMMELKPIFFDGTVVQDTKTGEDIVVPGCVKNGVPRETTEWIWSVFEASAAYSFNKSHAACYALIGYATAYLKANFPAEYMAALISSVMHTKDKVPFYVYECKRMGLKVLPPSVNESFSNFEPTADDTLRFGLTAISGVGEGVVEGIVAEREANGPYRSLWDFCDRVTNINSRELNNLIKAGAFDWVGKPRKGLLSVSDQALKRAKKVREKKAEGQDSLFDFGSSVEAELSGMAMEDHPEIPDDRFSDDEMYALEREVTKGIYVTGHPLDSCRRQWERVRHLGIGQIGPEQLPEPDDVDERGKPRYKVVTVAGIVTNRRTLFTKRDNKRWLILTLEDLTGANEILLFNRELTEGNEEYLEEGSKIWMRVSVEEDKSGFGSQAGAEEGAEDGRQVKLIGKAYGKFDPATVDVPDFYDIKLPFEAVQGNPEMVRQVIKILKEHPGEEQSRILLMQEDEVVSSYATNVAVEPSEKLTQALKSALS